MPHKPFPEIQEILDQVFSAAEEIRHAVAHEMGFEDGKGPDFSKWFEYRDYYPGYSYPPSNVFLNPDRSMVFQFALAGFSEKDITLEFRGDYLVFSAKLPEEEQNDKGVRYFKHRLKLKSIAEQHYYVPADKFNQDETKAIHKNAILTVTVPAKDAPSESTSRSVPISKESE